MDRLDGLNRTKIGFADLVRLWAQALRMEPDCDAPPAGWVQVVVVEGADAATRTSIPSTPRFVSEERDEKETRKADGLAAQLPTDALSSVEVVEPTQAPRLQMRVLAVLGADFEPEETNSGISDQEDVPLPLAWEDYTPFLPGGSAPVMPLAPRSRWWPALRWFTPRVPVGHDLQKIVDLCAKGRPPRRLPKLLRRGQFRRLLVLRDNRKCMRPYMQDFDALIVQLKAQPQAVELAEGSIHGLPAHVPSGVDAVLILSDLGLCAATEPVAAAKVWAAWARSLATRGVAVQAWVPLSALRLPDLLVRDLPCIPWHETSRFRRSRGTANIGATDACKLRATAWMAQLWPLLSIAQRIEPGLLRLARRLVGGYGQPEWEATLWETSDEHSAGEDVIQLLPSRLAKWREAFAELDTRTQLQVWHMLATQHGHLPRSTLIIERLIWASHARSPEVLDEVRQEIDQAVDWLRRIAAQETANSVLHRQAGTVHALHADFLHGLVARNATDAKFTGIHAKYYAPLAVVVGRLGEGAGVTARDWSQAMSSAPSRLDRLPWSLQLHYRFEGQFIEKWVSSAMPEISALPPILRTLSILSQDVRHSAIWQAKGEAPRLLSHHQPAVPGELQFQDDQGRHFLEFGYLRRASWQDSIGCDNYGIFCEVRVGSVNLCFRYIPPGTFLQGSSRDPVHEDEAPAHYVTIGSGFWLAETPCTQELWIEVFEKNPSYFKYGKEYLLCPVESVSWEEVCSFIKEFQKLLPDGCEVFLPSESQWEYSCRAGTRTEYWWGDFPDAEKANIDAARKLIGKGGAGTSPVYSYAPNPWGLYDMHGNVWEFCVDGKRAYLGSRQKDPLGPISGGVVAVRGGSWAANADSARAAFRGEAGITGAYQSRGFRLAIR